jgi:membrane dipeptidase
VNRRDCLVATLSAAALAPALRASAAQFVATPSVTSIDPAKYPDAWKAQRSTLVVDGLDGAALTENYLRMLKAGGVDCWHQSVGGLAWFAQTLTLLDKFSDRIVQTLTVREIRQAKEQGKIAHVAGWQSALGLLGDANGEPAIGNLRA